MIRGDSPRRIEQIPPLGRIQIEENARYDNGFLFQTGLEEIQPVADALWQVTQIEPDVEGRVRNMSAEESDTLEPVDDIVSFALEMCLQGFHFFQDFVRLEHRDCGFLKGNVGASVQIGSAGPNGLDEFFGADYPGYTPAGKAKAFG